MKKGIDVSYAQGVIDWRKVKEQNTVDFAMIRACYGWDNDNQIDRFLNENAAGVISANIPHGFYHYSYAQNKEDAIKEAKFFLKVIQGLKPDYPIAFDFEESFQIGGQGKPGFSLDEQLDIIDGFMQTVEAAGYYAVLYSTASALQRLRNHAPARLARYDIWVAHIDTEIPRFSGEYGMWQYSWKGRILGINGDVDLNNSYKDYPAIIKRAGLNKWEKQSEPEQPLPPDSEPIDWQTKYDELYKKFDTVLLEIQKVAKDLSKIASL